jgi:p-hydroxybenzoate 3-monooxygenase
MAHVWRTQVAIVGGGPAGLLLGHLLHRQGVDSVLLEARTRDYCEARIRAGVLEQATCDLLVEAGLAERMQRVGLVHGGISPRHDGVNHRIPFDELTGGRSVTVYGQTEVVKDLIAARADSGASLHFECADVQVSGLPDGEPIVAYTQHGERHELHATVIAGCDGLPAGHSVGNARAVRARVSVRVVGHPRRRGPVDRRAHLRAPCPGLCSAQHALALGQPALSPGRPDEDLAQWPDDRIWDELHPRLATHGWSLEEGPVTGRSITSMRRFVAAPMRYGALFLAGDAAHIVPPTGAKGLNLAVATSLAENYVGFPLPPVPDRAALHG